MRHHFEKNLPHKNAEEQDQILDKLEDIHTTSTDGTQQTKCFGIDPGNNQVQMSVENGGKLQVQVVGSNDINGGTPHRHLTIDANGRTLTNPLMTSTNTKLDTIETTLNSIETINTDAESHLGFIQANTNTNLSKVSSIDTKITQGNDSTLSTAQQCLIYGKDNLNNLDALKVNTQGALKVIQDSVEVLGSQGNVANNITLAFGSETSSLDITDYDHANIFIEDTSITVFDSYEMLVSVNDSDYYLYDTPFPTVRNSKREAVLKNLNLHGIKYIKFKNASSTDNYANVKITVVGTVN